MAIPSGSDPVELRVLSALTSGASTVLGVAAEVGEPESVVAPILEASVAEQTAVRLDLPGLPTYAVTPKGLALLGVSQDAPGAPVDALHDQVPATLDNAVVPDALTEEQLPPVAPTGMGPGTASGETSVSTDPVPSPRVRWRHVAYAVGYVLIGLVLLPIQPIVGGLAVVAGLVLAGYALRPLLATSATRVNGR